MLGDEGFDDLDDLLLLAAGKPGDGFEHLAGFAAGGIRVSPSQYTLQAE